MTIIVGVEPIEEASARGEFPMLAALFLICACGGIAMWFIY